MCFDPCSYDENVAHSSADSLVKIWKLSLTPSKCRWGYEGLFSLLDITATLAGAIYIYICMLGLR